MADKGWDALTQVSKTSDRVVRLAGQVSALSAEMRKRVRPLVRLETMLKLALRRRTHPPSAAPDELRPHAG